VILRVLAGLCLVLYAGLAQSTPTQAGEAARARQLLESRTWIDKAWGAHLAIGAHDPSLRELLVDNLRRIQPLREVAVNTAEYNCVQSLLDALIQTDAEVPSAVILPFERGWRPEVLLLLSLQRDNSMANEAALLAMLDEKPDWLELFAIGDLLARMQSQRFFRQTLEKIEFKHRITVRDSADRSVHTGMSSLAGLVSTRSVPKGFPPIGFYDLQGELYAFPAKAFSSPRPVYYRRIVVAGGMTIQWSTLKLKNPADVRQAYSLKYLPRPRHLATLEVQHLYFRDTTILWKTAEDFSQDAETAIDQQANDIRAFLEDAHHEGLGDVSGITLTIFPIVEDRREITHDRLPAVLPKVIVLN